MKRYRAGFTFIELLCVVAIIAVLAAILFPVFAQAREKARTTSCASNLQQLSMAMNLYAQDHNGRFPPADDQFAPVFSYVKNYSVFRCPSDPRPGPNVPPVQPAVAALELAPTGMPSPAEPVPLAFSYVYRGGLRNDDWGDIPFVGERIVEHYGGNPERVPAAGAKPPFWWNFFHSGGANRVTLCGSVKWIQQKVWAPINEAQKRQMAAVREQAKRSGDPSGGLQ
jgi:prepilin-type N-terminal cleavage/methylation domain-containing protein